MSKPETPKGIAPRFNGAELTRTWTYYGRDGEEVLGHVARYDGPDGKAVVPYFRRTGDLWRAGGPEEPSPLYGLHTLDGAGRVFVCEGEKATAALHALGLAAVTSQGGSNAAHKADWEPLSGVAAAIILPDNDAPGERYAEAVADILRGLPEPPRVRVLRLPGLPPSGDAHDWVAAMLGYWDGGPVPEDTEEALVAALEEMVSDAKEDGPEIVVTAPERPDAAPLLIRPDEPPERMDGSALGPLRGAAEAIAEAAVVPLELAAASVLAATALATQGQCDVKFRGRRFPLSLYLVTIARSGDRKSEADALALAAVREDERRLLRENARAFADYRAARDAHEEARRRVRLDKRKATQGDIRKALEELGPEPSPPPPPTWTVSSGTMQGVVAAFMAASANLGLFSDEGARFLGGWAMARDNRTATAAALCDLWGGRGVADITKGDGLAVAQARRLSAHLMVQPNIARGLLGDEELHEQGLLARFLVASPPSVGGARLITEEALEEMSVELAERTPAYASWCERLLALLRMPLPWVDAKVPALGLSPTALDVTRRASAVWRDYYNAVEGECGPGGHWEPAYPGATKSAEHALRLAGVFAAYRGAEAIDEADMTAGVGLARFYLREALRLRTNARAEPELVKAEALYRWLCSQPGRAATVADTYKAACGPRDADELELLADVLQRHGLAELVEQKRPRGGRPKRVLRALIAEEEAAA